MENHVGVGYCFYTCRNNSSLPSSDAISTMTPTSHQVIQVRDLGTTFKQANSRRKRPHLNPYIPQSSSPSVHTSLTFSSRRGGAVKLRAIISQKVHHYQASHRASHFNLKHLMKTSMIILSGMTWILGIWMMTPQFLLSGDALQL